MELYYNKNSSRIYKYKDGLYFFLLHHDEYETIWIKSDFYHAYRPDTDTETFSLITYDNIADYTEYYSHKLLLSLLVQGLWEEIDV